MGHANSLLQDTPPVPHVSCFQTVVQQGTEKPGVPCLLLIPLTVHCIPWLQLWCPDTYGLLLACCMSLACACDFGASWTHILHTPACREREFSKLLLAAQAGQQAPVQGRALSPVHSKKQCHRPP